MKSKADILVVEDEPLLREIMADWLGSEGYPVQTARDGIEALQILEQNRVSLIVTDIRMPRMDGVALLKKLKESAADYIPAIVFVSGFADIDPRQAYDLGAGALVEKPFTDEDLLSAVKRMLTPREELWRAAAPQTNSLLLQGDFNSVVSARESRQLAFGRGGFCLRSTAARTEGPVRFDLNFSQEPLRMSGHGSIRWVRTAATELGVEINGLAPDCLAQGIQLTVHSGTHSYIPGTARG
jgi:CheY-like chemotaxis protein